MNLTQIALSVVITGGITVLYFYTQIWVFLKMNKNHNVAVSLVVAFVAGFVFPLTWLYVWARSSAVGPVPAPQRRAR